MQPDFHLRAFRRRIEARAVRLPREVEDGPARLVRPGLFEDAEATGPGRHDVYSSSDGGSSGNGMRAGWRDVNPDRLRQDAGGGRVPATLAFAAPGGHSEGPPNERPNPEPSPPWHACASFSAIS